MTVRERIIRCRLIEKIDKQKDYSKKLGIINISKYKNQDSLINAAKDKK